MNNQDAGPALVHALRAVTMELDLFAARFAAEHGLHGSDLRALIALLDAERAGLSATPGWLGTRLSLQSAAVTALVDRLVHRGLVERARDAGDGRRIHLHVTSTAHDLGWSFFGPLIDGFVAETEKFSESELAVVRRFLEATADVVLAAGQ